MPMGCYNRTKSGFHFTKRVLSFFKNSVCDPFLRRGNSSYHGFLNRNQTNPFGANRFYCDQTKPHPGKRQDTKTTLHRTKPYPTSRGRLYGFGLSNQPFAGSQDTDTTRHQTKPNPTSQARLFRSQFEELLHNVEKTTVFKRETIPFTKRKHFVLSIYKESTLPKRITQDIGEEILPRTHPESVRVSLIAQNIVMSLQELLKIKQVSSDPVSEGSFNELLESLNWEVVVVDNDTEHSYCLGGGKIVMFTGLLKKLRSDAEIASVIGHKVGHILARHYGEGYAFDQCRPLLWICVKHLVVMYLFPVLLYMSFLSLEIGRYSFHLFMFHLMRKEELEADYIGLLLMASAGYDPRVAPLVIESLNSRNRIQSSYDAFFTSHPYWRTRVKYMTQPKVMEEALRIYRESRAGKKDD